jgi:hypothetical protein
LIDLLVGGFDLALDDGLNTNPTLKTLSWLRGRSCRLKTERLALVGKGVDPVEIENVVVDDSFEVLDIAFNGLALAVGKLVGEKPWFGLHNLVDSSFNLCCGCDLCFGNRKLHWKILNKSYLTIEVAAAKLRACLVQYPFN